jgi:hypothetical protein
MTFENTPQAVHQTAKPLPTIVIVGRSWIPLLLILMRAAPGPTKTLAYLSLPFYALFGRRQAVVALALLWLFNTLSHGFGLPSGWAAGYRHLTIITATLSVLLLHVGRPPRSRCQTFVWLTAGLCVLLMLHSFLLSTAPDISALKAIAFSLTLMTLIVGWSSLDVFNEDLAKRQIAGILILIAVMSIPLVGSGMGYMRNSRGFQGVLVHPQNFGPAMAFLATWLFARWLTGSISPILAWTVFPLSFVWIYLSQARVGMVSFLVGAFVAIASGPLISMLNQWRSFATTRKRRVALIGLVGILAMAIAGRSISSKVKNFIGKGSEVSSLESTFEASRGFLIDRMKVNISQRPFTGIGLGVPSIPGINDEYIVRDPFFGIVLMAPVEKGVLPYAMVEEFGWPLAILWLAWFVAVQLMACRAGVVNSAVCASALISNVGEAAFFAPGGSGMLPLTLALMCATAPAASLATSRSIVVPPTVPAGAVAGQRIQALQRTPRPSPATHVA